ncbi:MAG: hypothetical protein IKG87_13750 [Clostridia bacterium]|nr:hypothetical protein [Clostridia bacterium]
MSLNYQEFILVYGATAIVSFLLTEIISERLNGVVTRGVIREAQSVIIQMTLTWCVYLVLLFLMHMIFSISRIRMSMKQADGGYQKQTGSGRDSGGK